MEETLKKLDPEKLDRLINSALEEFGRNSYAKASTNTIVNNAGISKGLLFHYFKNKRGLYDYLERFVFQKMVDEILAEIDWNETDLFARIKQIAIIKMGVLARYPGIEAFSKAIYEQKSFAEIKQMFEEMVPDLYHQIYTKNIDMNRFRDDLDFDTVIQIIQWTVEKYGEEQMALVKKTGIEPDFSRIASGVDSYMAALRKAFCKQGGVENDSRE